MMTRAWRGVCAGVYAGLCIGVWAVAWADPPPPPPELPAPPPAASKVPRAQPPPADAESDEEFIEFLGADDVGDAAWWEFLKRTAPRKDSPSAPAPPQDAKP